LKRQVTPKDLNELRKVERGQPWARMATWSPFWMFGTEGPTAGHWTGRVYAVDADTGAWKWRLKSNYPIHRGCHDGRAASCSSEIRRSFSEKWDVHA
jgi:hypothetical protein